VSEMRAQSHNRQLLRKRERSLTPEMGYGISLRSRTQMETPYVAATPGAHDQVLSPETTLISASLTFDCVPFFERGLCFPGLVHRGRCLDSSHVNNIKPNVGRCLAIVAGLNPQRGQGKVIGPMGRYSQVTCWNLEGVPGRNRILRATNAATST
jgi:hypothetical protein